MKGRARRLESNTGQPWCLAYLSQVPTARGPTEGRETITEAEKEVQTPAVPRGPAPMGVTELNSLLPWDFKTSGQACKQLH